MNKPDQPSEDLLQALDDLYEATSLLLKAQEVLGREILGFDMSRLSWRDSENE